MGITLIVGAACFFLALVKLLFLSIKIRKFPKVVLLNVRILFFIFIYFMVFAFFIAYIINDTANSSNISTAYEEYFTCLTGYSYTPPADCSLSGDAVNIPLVMLKGFAVSSLGVLLFVNFLSWDLIKQWYLLARALFQVLRYHDMERLMLVISMVGGRSSTTLHAPSLTMATVEEKEEEEDDDDEEEEEEDTEASSTSSNSGTVQS